MVRDAKGFIRNKMQLPIFLLRQVIIGLLIIAVFWNLGGNTRKAIYVMAGALYFVAVNQVMMSSVL